jgi:hypothetical protein
VEEFWYIHSRPVLQVFARGEKIYYKYYFPPRLVGDALEKTDPAINVISEKKSARSIKGPKRRIVVSRVSSAEGRTENQNQEIHP